MIIVLQVNAPAYMAQGIKESLAKAPAVDAVEVVRCKDCVGFNASDKFCKGWEAFVREDDFCSYGERRSGDG